MLTTPHDIKCFSFCLRISQTPEVCCYRTHFFPFLFTWESSAFNLIGLASTMTSGRQDGSKHEIKALLVSSVLMFCMVFSSFASNVHRWFFLPPPPPTPTKNPNNFHFVLWNSHFDVLSVIISRVVMLANPLLVRQDPADFSKDNDIVTNIPCSKDSFDHLLDYW